MMPWAEDPSPSLCAVFGDIARTRMADVPICNPALCVEAVGFRRLPDGPWVGVMITPWAINLLCLPAAGAAWPELPACSKYSWQFPSGLYEFTVADEARLGRYHLCSLFSPAQEFPDQAQARLTALAVVHALFGQPIEEAAVAAASPEQRPSRRAFLGLGR